MPVSVCEELPPEGVSNDCGRRQSLTETVWEAAHPLNSTGILWVT